MQVYSFSANEGLAPSTIKHWSAVRHLQLSVGLPVLKIADMACLEQVVKGVKEYGKGIRTRENGYPLLRIFSYGN